MPVRTRRAVRSWGREDVSGLGQSTSFTPPSNPGNGNLRRVFDLQAEGNRIVAVVPVGDIIQVGSSSGTGYDP